MACIQTHSSNAKHPLNKTLQGLAKEVVFSGAHPGEGIRSRSEASAMVSYALQLLSLPPPPPST